MGSLGFTYPDEVTVLMAPFPLHGHLNQLLHFSRLLALNGVTVHFATTASHNRRARRRIHGWDPLSVSNIVFRDLPQITLPENRGANHNPFPPQLDQLLKACSSLRPAFAKLLNELCAENRRVVVINDSLMGSVVQDFVQYENTEAYTFHSVSAYTMFFFLWEKSGRPFAVDEEILANLPSMEGCFTPEFISLIRSQYKFIDFSSGRIYNTGRAIENKFIELLEKPEIIGNQKQWALGPFNPVNVTSNSNDSSRHKCLKWLDKQGKNSVILVSFGTTTSLSIDQIMELAIGLEASGMKFVWVLRDADGAGSSSDEGTVKLPAGYEERNKERGIIVRDWAPQLEILGHRSIGGFMSHCGWNSCMESISAGVPIAAWPMHSDQPRNAVLMTGVLKIGVAVRDWKSRKEAIVKSSEIAKSVRRLMAEEEGAAMRQRAAMLRRTVVEGGSSQGELDSFISHILRFGSNASP